MSHDDLLRDSAEELFEEAPCGYLSTDMHGIVVQVNRTFERWTGYRRDELLGKTRFQDLLAPGGRIYYDTHYAPLLRIQGSVREIAVEIVRSDGTRLPALINSTVRSDQQGRPRVIRTTIFDATERRGYERELVREKQRAEDVARALQQSLLSSPLPVSPRLELAVSYKPGVADLDVGGDWYDAFWLSEPDLVALVVGDVVGRGIEAAAKMGQLRSAVRALAFGDIAPATLLERLDLYAERHQVGAMTTVLCADLDLRSGELRYAAAGHPPPLLAGADGEARLLWDGRSLPIGMGSDPPLSRDQGRVALKPGDRLLLFSDGLVERRTSSLPDDLTRLAEVAAEHAALSVGQLTRKLTEVLPDREHPDDVCLLVAQLNGADIEAQSLAARGGLDSAR